MPYLIGQCCLDQIITPDPVNPDASGKNEPILFDNVATLLIPWNNTRKNRFGAAGVLYVEIRGEDGKYRHTQVEIVPDSRENTTSYFIDFGGPSSGRVTLT